MLASVWGGQKGACRIAPAFCMGILWVSIYQGDRTLSLDDVLGTIWQIFYGLRTHWKVRTAIHGLYMHRIGKHVYLLGNIHRKFWTYLIC
jgi:hypothetical protein